MQSRRPGLAAGSARPLSDAYGLDGVQLSRRGEAQLVRRSPASHPRPLTARECATLDRIGRDLTHKEIAAEFGLSINTVGNLAANAYKKLDVHGAAAAVHTHRDAHFYCGTRVDFGPIRERLKASRSTSSCP